MADTMSDADRNRLDALRPRFFVELNEPFLIFGINPMGYAPGLMFAGLFAGLQLFAMIPVAILPFSVLAKRMGTEPDFLRLLGAKMRESRAWVAAKGERSEPVVVDTAEGYRVHASAWGQWNAFHNIHPEVALREALGNPEETRYR